MIRDGVTYLFTLAAVICLFLLLAISPSDKVKSSNISPAHVEVVKLNSFEQKSRTASVKVEAPSGGHGTGTLFSYRGNTLVFTAKHVVMEGSTYLAIANSGEIKAAELLYTDSSADFAVLLVDEFNTIKPVTFKKHNYNPKNLVDLGIIFSGYPSIHNLLTSRGRIAGFEVNSLVIHSVAWGGSSGSSVFSSNGDFIGILFGVSTDTPFGFPTLIDNIIWVAPYYSIDWASLDDKISEAKNEFKR